MHLERREIERSQMRSTERGEEKRDCLVRSVLPLVFLLRQCRFSELYCVCVVRVGLQEARVDGVSSVSCNSRVLKATTSSPTLSATTTWTTRTTTTTSTTTST